jgi:hypothetical protein
MNASGPILLSAALFLTGNAGLLHAQSAESQQPVEVSSLPYIEIFSPTFFWNDEADFVRQGATNCPKGRAVAGGVKIDRGNASLRILESYPDGESWVLRVVNRQKPANIQSLQVRGFALCMLPAARKASVLLSQRPRLLHRSAPFALPTGYVSSSGRQACPDGGLVISGGFGIDPNYRGPSMPRLELSYPDPKGWNVRAVNGVDPALPPAEARAHAVCVGAKDGVDIRDFQTVYFVEKDVPIKHSNGIARQSIGCGGEQAYAIAGGMRTIRGRIASVEMEESFPDSPTSWTIGATNRGDRRAGDATVRIYVTCIKK